MRSGPLRGIQSGSVIQWRGVPYAAPPTGERRFCPPEPAPAWEGIREASRFGPDSPQAVTPLLSMLGGQSGQASEDCLYLNVYAPATAGDKLPVMVWIHGGAFIAGSGSSLWYDGDRFAAEGRVIVVTLNYRLGALGFVALGDRFPAAGNCGLLDQLCALQWVQDNIAAFGGDPAQVTVFGESAGAMSIGLMLTMPGARGLFQRAILQSGASAAYRSRAEAEEVAAQILAAFGGTVDELAEAPVERILEAQNAVTGGSDSAAYLAFRPVVDGTTIPAAPDQVMAAGGGLDVPVLVGTNRDEMTLFFTFDPAMVGLTPDQIDARAGHLLGAEVWERLAGHYRSRRPEGDAGALMAAVTTDLVFRIPALRLADAMTDPDRQSPLWMYRFDWSSPFMGGRLGATHALDVPFVWNLVDLPGVEMFTGSEPGRHHLAAAMHAAWVAFATTGDPATALLPEWPPYRTPDRATMLFDAECRVAEDPNGVERRLWSDVD